MVVMRQATLPHGWMRMSMSLSSSKLLGSPSVTPKERAAFLQQCAEIEMDVVDNADNDQSVPTNNTHV